MTWSLAHLRRTEFAVFGLLAVLLLGPESAFKILFDEGVILTFVLLLGGWSHFTNVELSGLFSTGLTRINRIFATFLIEEFFAAPVGINCIHVVLQTEIAMRGYLTDRLFTDHRQLQVLL